MLSGNVISCGPPWPKRVGRSFAEEEILFPVRRFLHIPPGYEAAKTKVQWDRSRRNKNPTARILLRMRKRVPKTFNVQKN